MIRPDDRLYSPPNVGLVRRPRHSEPVVERPPAGPLASVASSSASMAAMGAAMRSLWRAPWLLHQASVLAVSVIPYGPFPVGFVPLDEESAQDAAPSLEEAKEVLGGLEVETQAYGGGSPAWVMSDYAERGEVDLIVVGSPHRGKLGRVFLGSVASSLLHGAACPVAVAPRGYATEDHELPLRMIAVAYDGTRESRIALQRAETLALALGASLRLLTVVRPPRATPYPAPRDMCRRYRRAREGPIPGDGSGWARTSR